MAIVVVSSVVVDEGVVVVIPVVVESKCCFCRSWLFSRAIGLMQQLYLCCVFRGC